MKSKRTIADILREIEDSLRVCSGNLDEAWRHLHMVKDRQTGEERKELDEGFETSYCAKCGKQTCVGDCDV